ncbi:MAG: HAD-IA family hydrolase [Nevskiales bacterium]|nr:HAD-IA family hydrolase [Nevskiales bacterium]
MSILQFPRARPRVLLFDWHATLVDTMDAMYYALEDVLPRLVALGLIDRLVAPAQSKTLEDAKLVKYVRDHARLHPKLKAERKVSRTDIFEVLFGDDQDAKATAHRAFDESYARHFGIVRPMEADARSRLEALQARGLRIGVLTNRQRRFMAHEVYTVDGDGWHELFETIVCGDDVERRKPHPDLIHRALDELGESAALSCWYVGDSTTDVIAARRAGVTAIFYNGAGWDRQWIDKIFPGTVRHPHVPDAVVGSLDELHALIDRLV